MKLVILAILLSGCADVALSRQLSDPLSHITVCVESVLPQETVSATVEAVVFWEKSLGLPMSSHYGIANACDIFITGLEFGEISKTGNIPPTSRAAESSMEIPCSIELIYGKYDLDGIDRAYVIAHEIGHCFGAVHQPSGLMQKEYYGQTLPNCLDSLSATSVIDAGIIDTPSLDICPSDNG